MDTVILIIETIWGICDAVFGDIMDIALIVLMIVGALALIALPGWIVVETCRSISDQASQRWAAAGFTIAFGILAFLYYDRLPTTYVESGIWRLGTNKAMLVRQENLPQNTARTTFGLHYNIDAIILADRGFITYRLDPVASVKAEKNGIVWIVRAFTLIYRGVASAIIHGLIYGLWAWLLLHLQFVSPWALGGIVGLYLLLSGRHLQPRLRDD